MWEMVTGKRPWAGSGNLAVAVQVTTHGCTLEQPNDDARCPPRLWALMQQCWAINPDARPSAAQLYQELSGLILDHHSAA